MIASVHGHSRLGEYPFKMFVVVGTLDDVKTTLAALVKVRVGK